MLIEFLVSKFFFIVPMLVGGIMFVCLTRFISMGTGITHAEAKEEINNGNVATALYFGLRVLAVAIAVGLFVVAGTTGQ